MKKSKLLNMTVMQAAAEFMVAAILLSLLGWLAHCRVNQLLDETLEEALLKHMKTLAYSVENQFHQEIAEIQDGALMVKRGWITPKDLIEIAKIQGQGSTIGIVQDDGTTLVGDQFPKNKLEILSSVFAGRPVISYDSRLGLLFAVPTTINDRRCAYYETYNDEMLKEEFGVYFYDGAGIVTLGYRSGEWTEISYDTKNLGLFYRQSTDVNYKMIFQTEVVDVLKHESQAIARYNYRDNDYFTFGIKILGKDFALYGCVPYEAIAVGIEYVHVAMLAVFVMLFLVLLIVARYLVKTVENKELQHEKQLADQASKTKSDFLSQVSHELRTPLNAILGMDEMILRSTNDPSLLEYAENIHNAGNNLLGLVNDILDFSKIEAGKMEIIPVEYQLSSLLNDLVNMIHTRAEKKGLDFIVNAPHDLPTLLHGDEIRIKQVVTNILTNAVKYTEKGAVTMKVEFQKITDDRILLWFEVKDTGIGIKPEDLPKLFSAFERIEEKRNRTIEGTGLGMNITQRLLQMMHSKLEVSSVYGQGSIFSFAVEQKVLDWTPLGDFEEAFRHSLTQRKVYHEKFTAPDAKILVVDDTVMNLTVVKGLLKQTQIQITTAESGFECLDLVKQEKFDIIFLDHRMPTMDGLETLQEMKKLERNLNQTTPVIALTANAISGAREQYLAAGMSDYLTKPIDPNALETMIMKYLPPEKIGAASDQPTVVEEPTIDLPEWLSTIDELNVFDGVKHCGSAEDYLNALTVFAQSIESNADEIEGMFRAEDWKNYTTKVHALKSTARVIGAAELSDRAKRMEDAGNACDVDLIKASTEALLDQYRSFAKKLSPLIKRSDDDADKPLIGDDELAEALEALREMSASFDYDSVIFVLESLDEYRLPDDQLERFKRIRSAVSKLDWEAVQAALN